LYIGHGQLKFVNAQGLTIWKTTVLPDRSITLC
jgi:hypothetical protein